MQIEYKKEYSHNLGREMEFIRYGHSGKPVLVFPSQDGTCNQYQEFGMVNVLSDYIEQSYSVSEVLTLRAGQTFTETQDIE